MGPPLEEPTGCFPVPCLKVAATLSPNSKLQVLSSSINFRGILDFSEQNDPTSFFSKYEILSNLVWSLYPFKDKEHQMWSQMLELDFYQTHDLCERVINSSSGGDPDLIITLMVVI